MRLWQRGVPKRRWERRLAGASWMVFLCLLWGTLAARADVNLDVLINEAGRQRMLTQRIVLSYAQIGLGVLPAASRERLFADVALFARQLAHLKAAAHDSYLREALDDVERRWRDFQALATGEVSRAGARRLLFYNDDLLFATNKVVQILQDLSGESSAHLVNIAGRERMLSQRLAKLYMLREWGIETITTRDQMAQARDEFARGLAALWSDPETTKAIRSEIGDVEVQWRWFENALTLTADDAFRLIVAESSQRILAGMERVTTLYEQLHAR